MDISLLKQHVNAGGKLTEGQAAFLIRNDMPSLAAFMIENNPGSVNFALRNILGYDHLKFQPDQAALARQMEIIINGGKSDELMTVVKNFRMDASKLPAKLAEQLQLQFANVA